MTWLMNLEMLELTVKEYMFENGKVVIFWMMASYLIF